MSASDNAIDDARRRTARVDRYMRSAPEERSRSRRSVLARRLTSKIQPVSYGHDRPRTTGCSARDTIGETWAVRSCFGPLVNTVYRRPADDNEPGGFGAHRVAWACLARRPRLGCRQHRWLDAWRR